MNAHVCVVVTCFSFYSCFVYNQRANSMIASNIFIIFGGNKRCCSLYNAYKCKWKFMDEILFLCIFVNVDCRCHCCCCDPKARDVQLQSNWIYSIKMHSQKLTLCQHVFNAVDGVCFWHLNKATTSFPSHSCFFSFIFTARSVIQLITILKTLWPSLF